MSKNVEYEYREEYDLTDPPKPYSIETKPSFEAVAGFRIKPSFHCLEKVIPVSITGTTDMPMRPLDGKDSEHACALIRGGKKFSGDLEKFIFALMDTPLDYDVKQLKAAMKRSKSAVIIEILCSRTVDQLRAIRVSYEKEYKKALDADVAGDSPGEFRDLLVSLVTGDKDGSLDTNDVQAKDDADRLFTDFKLAKKDGTHFLHILATQNQYQLRKVFAHFQEHAGKTIEKAIEKEFSGDLQKSYLTIVRAASDKQKFFAQQLYTSMKGLGTRDTDLIRIVVTRSEVDLEDIKNEFVELYQKNLDDMVKGDTSGAYRDALLAIINGNHAIAY